MEGLSSQPVCLGLVDLALFAVGGHALLRGHLIGPHLEAHDAGPLAKLLLRPLSLLTLRLFGAQLGTFVAVLLRLVGNGIVKLCTTTCSALYTRGLYSLLLAYTLSMLCTLTVLPRAKMVATTYKYITTI